MEREKDDERNREIRGQTVRQTDRRKDRDWRDTVRQNHGEIEKQR